MRGASCHATYRDTGTDGRNQAIGADRGKGDREEHERQNDHGRNVLGCGNHLLQQM